ncbi:uncharacterized protein [Periplaneta americana]|uniref:uncharacterized protein isoform X2 n=1 Tax=Periplaneta americana TaxID=6978 RepID=UPI0037E91854
MWWKRLSFFANVTSVFLPEKTCFYKTRTITLAVLGLVMSLYGLSAGTTQWTLRSDGSIVNQDASLISSRYLTPVFTLTLGLSNTYNIVNIISSLALLYGAVRNSELFLLPALVLTAADIIADLSDAVIAATLIAKHIGMLESLMYSAVSTAIIMFETYLWYGVVKFYELNVKAEKVH